MIARRIVTAILSHGREIFAWAMYDWANSAYTSLSITALVYYISVFVVGPETIAARNISEFADSLGWDLAPKNCGALVWSWGISLSMFTAALVSPFIGAMADARASKSRWLAVTALTGAAGSVLLGLLPTERAGLIIGLFLFVSLMFELSFGFYNAFLPELATEATMDEVSALGFSLGYVGGGIALSLEFLVLAFGARIGLSEPVDQLRVGLLIMGVWWGLFSLPAVLILRDRALPRAPDASFGRTAINAVGEVRRTLTHLRQYRTLAFFLVGFLFYNDGIQTVISQSQIFAERDLNFTAQELLVLILAFQFICLPGAMIVGKVTAWIGQKRTLMICLSIWVALLATAYFIQTKAQFWCLSVVLGIVMGGTQSVARAMMGLMTPKSRTAEFFGFFNFSGKATSWLGTFLFGAVIARTGSARLAILSLLVLFIVGLLITAPVNVAQGQREAVEA